MKILVLAIVLCVASSQAQGNHGRRSRPNNKRQAGHDTPVTGEEMMAFVIKTLESLQSFFADHQWGDLSQYSDISLELPSARQTSKRKNQVAREYIEDQDLDPMGWSPLAEPGEHQAQWSRRRNPPTQSGRPPSRPNVPPPPPPRPTSPPPERRSWPGWPTYP